MSVWVYNSTTDHHDEQANHSDVVGLSVHDQQSQHIFFTQSDSANAYQEFWSQLMGLNNKEQFLEDSLW